MSIAALFSADCIPVEVQQDLGRFVGLDRRETREMLGGLLDGKFHQLRREGVVSQLRDGRVPCFLPPKSDSGANNGRNPFALGRETYDPDEIGRGR